MCGRYSQASKIEKLVRMFGLKPTDLALPPRYNIAPSQDAPVIVADEEGGRELRMFRWGLIPSWAKDQKVGYKMINARAETLLEKPSFKRPFLTRRCLVVADGFYEWKKEAAGKDKTPYRVALKSGEPFAMAGLWDAWKNPEGKEVRSFTVVTTSANAALKPIHERMPAILQRKDEGAWLDPKAGGDKLSRLLAPYPGKDLETFPISPLVNIPKNDTADIIRPLR